MKYINLRCEVQNIKLCNMVGLAARAMLAAGRDDAVSNEIFDLICDRFFAVKSAAIKLGLSNKDVDNISRHESDLLDAQGY